MIQKKYNETQLVQIISKQIGNIIYTGPFAGLEIPQTIIPILKLAEMLGLYESCLHTVFSDLINRNISNIMIIGGHKGYYPAGMSNLLSPKKMYVFEMDEEFIPHLESWVELNHLQPYIMGKEATSDILENFNDSIDFLLIDCEGAEYELLNPNQFKWQSQSDILVEIHHFYNHKIMGAIIERFKDTHQIDIIYDDINEDAKIKNILQGLGIKGIYQGHPLHRWIFKNNEKIITSGVFLYLKANNR